MKQIKITGPTCQNPPIWDLRETMTKITNLTVIRLSAQHEDNA